MDKTKEVIIYERDEEILKISLKDVDTRINYMDESQELEVIINLNTGLYSLTKNITVNVGNIVAFYNNLNAMDDILVGKALLNNGLYGNEFILTIGSDKRTGYFDYVFELTQYDKNNHNEGRDHIVLERSLDQTFLRETISEFNKLIY